MKFNPTIWVRRRLYRHVVLGLLLAGSIGAALIDPWLCAAGVVLAVVLQIVGNVADALWADKLRGRVKAAAYKVCPYCLYDLTHLGQEGRCPECGNIVEWGVLKNAWQDSWVFVERH